jgi:opacity protein-like surface antigen
MKTRVLTTAALLILATTTYAAGPVSFGFQATGANINVDGLLKEVYGFGFGGGVHLDINLPLILSIRVQGDYTTFGIDDAKLKGLLVNWNPGTTASQFTVDGGRFNILSLFANTKVSPLPLPLLSPYLTGGVGIARMSASDLSVKHPTLQFNNIAGGTGDTNFSANIGVGVDLDLIALKLYLEARYTWIFASGATSTYAPVSLGVTF